MPNLQIALSKQFTLPNALNFVTIRNVFLLAIIISTATMLYSVSEMRGIFADGSNYMVRILASEDFISLSPRESWSSSSSYSSRFSPLECDLTSRTCRHLVGCSLWAPWVGPLS